MEFQFHRSESWKKAKRIIRNKEAENSRYVDHFKERWGIIRADKKFGQLEIKNKSDKIKNN